MTNELFKKKKNKTAFEKLFCLALIEHLGGKVCPQPDYMEELQQLIDDDND